jgi:cellulose synthase/poly-beta-1,6-N-acetylglucosamine synthase-like glycosyltransferase
MVLIVLIFSSSYLILHLIFFYGYRKSILLCGNKLNNEIFVTVIVAARNEEQNIKHCINSLKQINYNFNKFEVIFVDDNSKDRTYEIMIDETLGNKNFKIIKSQDSIQSNLKGKANAIDTAIKISRGDIIFTTDADCNVQPDWINELLKYYDEQTGMVCGFTNFIEDKSVFTKLQSLDWIYLLGIASSSCGIKNIISCIGNNLTFRKKVYVDMGGYSSIKFSVTEDMALMRTIRKENKFEIKYPVERNTIVFTKPCSNFIELMQQKRRWFKGGVKVNFLGYITGIELYLANMIFIFGIFFLPVYIFFIFLLNKLISELLIIILYCKKMGIKKLIRFFPLYQFYIALYGLILPWTFIFNKKIKWKNRKF